MRKLTDLFLSMQITAVIFVLLALSIASATFIENDFGTATARLFVYNAKWFEILLLAGALNLLGSIIIHKLYRKEKLTLFLFHFSFIIIIAGAALTRYTGFEGYIHIREGNSSDLVISESTYFGISANSGSDNKVFEETVLLSPLSKRFPSERFKLNGENATVKIRNYMPNGEEGIEPAENGVPMLQMMVFSKGGRVPYLFGDKETKEIQGIPFTFNDSTASGVQIFTHDNALYIRSPFEFTREDIETGESIPFRSNAVFAADTMKVYSLNSVVFILSEYTLSGRPIAEALPDAKSGEGTEAVFAEVEYKGDKKEVTLWNRLGAWDSEKVNAGGAEFVLSFGHKPVQIPFLLRLEDFILKRYPNSNSPSSFESKVTVIDEQGGVNKPADIFMNNILRYKGYRFYQSSYDADEAGTILSVNRDMPGTTLTYIGYLLLAAGMILSLVNPASRFRKLLRLSSELHKKRAMTFIMTGLMLPAVSSMGQEFKFDEKVIIPEDVAKKYGELLVQDNSGRIKPMNTLASDFMRKIFRDNTFHGQNGEQVILGMVSFSEYWRSIPVIKISGSQLRDTLGLSSKYASYMDLHPPMEEYKLKARVEAIYRKDPSERTKFENEILKVDEKFNICTMIYSGTLLRLFPFEEEMKQGFLVSPGRKMEVFIFLAESFYGGIPEAVESGNWDAVMKKLTDIKSFQYQEGIGKIPAESRQKAEIFSNKVDIFGRLSSFYGLTGLIIIVLQFISAFSPRRKFSRALKFLSWFVIVLFGLHTLGLALRWYISWHAPWSNGYETMILIAWAGVLAGLIFSRDSKITLGATALLASVVMSVAHMSWMDPQITNLVPVLKSYWLIIHVAVITSSYGFFALGAILGVINLCLMIIRSRKNYAGIEMLITELTYNIEIIIIVGLYLVTTGTFLGGVWANESWGRYWGWDAKESWALITVIVYAFAAHMRLIPGLRGNYALNLAAVLGFGSVIMTYFGVNFYLAGLHSYAKGDPVPVPNAVLISIVIIAALGVTAYLNERALKKDSTLQKGD